MQTVANPTISRKLSPSQAFYFAIPLLATLGCNRMMEGLVRRACHQASARVLRRCVPRELSVRRARYNCPPLRLIKRPASQAEPWACLPDLQHGHLCIQCGHCEQRQLL